jgi:hypothetical protein
MPIVTATWEDEAEGSLESTILRPAWQHIKTQFQIYISTNEKNNYPT